MLSRHKIVRGGLRVSCDVLLIYLIHFVLEGVSVHLLLTFLFQNLINIQAKVLTHKT